MNQSILSALDDITGILQSLPEAFGNRSKALVRFYDVLNQLHAGGPFSPVDFASALSVVPPAPEPLHSLLESAQRAFSIRRPFSEMREPLSRYRDIWKERYGSLPEAQLLAREATRWLEYLDQLEQQHEQPAKLEIGLSPSLDLTYLEEREESSGVRIVNLPIEFANSGRLPALGIEVNYMIEGARAPEQSSLSGDPYTELLPRGIGEGQNLIKTIRLEHAQQGRVEIWARYHDIMSEQAPRTTGRFAFDLLVSSKIDRKPNNLYTPDLPLTSEWQLQNLMKGRHLEIVESILSDPYLRTGRLYVVRGLKRSGKTSVLHELRWRMRQTEHYLPVYIDLESWTISLRQDHATIDGQGIWYELADSIARETSILSIETECQGHIDGYLDQYQDTIRMRYQSFIEFVELVQDKTKRQIVLLIDELDSWIRAPEFENDAKTLLLQLSSLAQQRKCAIVLAHGWSHEEWEARYTETRIRPVYHPLELLNKGDIVQLAELIPIPYTKMALDLIWRLTGGWPGLVQSLLYSIVEEVKQRNRDRDLVDVGVVKSLVNTLLGTPDYRAFLRSCLGGFDSAEIALLEKLVELGMIRKDSGRIEGVRKVPGRGVVLERKQDLNLPIDSIQRALSWLESQQAIEPVWIDPNSYRLRIGLLSYPAVLDLYRS